MIIEEEYLNGKGAEKKYFNWVNKELAALDFHEVEWDDGMLYDLYEDIRDDIAQEEAEEQNKIYNDTQCIFHFFNMDMTDEEILEKWNDEEICEESVEKLNEIKEKYIITEEEKEEILKKLKKI